MMKHSLKEITLLDHKNIYDVKEHHHNYYEVVFYISGKGEIIINGKKFPFSDNYLSITIPGSEHREYSFTNVKLLYIGFSIENVDGSILLQNGVYKCPYNLHILQLLKEILFVKNNGDFFQEDIIDSYLNSLEKLLSVLVFKETANSRKMIEIKAYINKNIKKKINAEIVSKYFNYNYDYLRKLFKEYYNISISEYILSKKLQCAMEYLKKTNYSVNQIAKNLSFTSTSHFIKSFKNYYKITPKQFLINYDKNAIK